MDIPAAARWIISAAGAVVVLKTAYGCLDFAWRYVRPTNVQKYLHEKEGKPAWALVTGATAGIGKSLAFEFAARGFNVVLHGRNASKVKGVEAQISEAYPGREFRTFVVDGMACGKGDCEGRWFKDVVDLVSDINLTVLVNNAGGGPTPSFGSSDTYSPQTIMDTIILNAAFPTLMSAALTPTLSRNAPSLVINMCSMTDNGLPLVPFYGSAKAYLMTLSNAMWRESRMDQKGIDVEGHRIGLTTETTLVKEAPSFTGPPASSVAKAIIARSGHGHKAIVPHPAHALQQTFVNLLPGWMADRMFIDVMRSLRDEQDEALKKAS